MPGKEVDNGFLLYQLLSERKNEERCAELELGYRKVHETFTLAFTGNQLNWILVS